MTKYLKIFLLCLLFPVLTGCTSLVTYIEDLQKQSVDEHERAAMDRRSVNFQPQYRFKVPQRGELTPVEKRLVGAAPPRQGKVVLDGAVRYYSANGHVCQYINVARYQPGAGRKSACFIGGRWVLAAPVLNTQSVK
uniref:Lipoprotein n=1 Tax=uncultured Thiotrichaceae bacterium TaxID=298394 RepID=A0A6S6UGN4_9GAMM|nr:MAG: Unknown protein [uncultured Thiotrichaceae bacterium]